MTTEYTKNFSLALPDFRMGPWHDLLNDDLRKIDQILYGALSSVDTPVWANSTAYIVGQTALDSASGTTYMCNFLHTSAPTGTFAADRAAHPTYWIQLLAGFAPRGQWTQNTNYFPYDLVYDSSLGIMALCKQTHVSTPTGNIKTDAVYWSFLVDMSGSSLATAVAVTYSNATSGIPPTNVQGAIDYIQTEIVSLNNVNVTQGNNITALQTSDGTQNTNITGLTTRMTAAEGVNTTQDTNIGNLTTRVTALEASASGFPSGTKMLFYQAAAPTGWTKDTTHSDKILRVVSGSGGGSGGSNPFLTVNSQTTTGNHTLTVAEMPSHAHSGFVDGGYCAAAGIAAGGNPRYGTPGTDGYAGGDGAHNHPITMSIQYIDIIIASKN